MRDIISLHVGQAGVQAGNSLWELLLAEHGLSEEGYLHCEDGYLCGHDSTESFFYATSQNKLVPKCLLVDLEPTVIDEVRIGAYRSLFHKDRLISGPEDASGNFARGFFTIGKLIMESIGRQLRKLFEACSCVNGFMIYRSLGGGTGSGLTSTIFDYLSEFPKTPKIELSIYPSPTLSSSTVEPYNAIIAEHFCMEDIDVGLMFDNEALFEMCGRYLDNNHPTFTSINQLLCQVISSMTASMRFPNILNCDLTVLQTNLVPYPRIHFPLCNFAPILSHQCAETQNTSINDITHAVFERENQMIKIDTTYGRYMSCALFYRGGISPKEVYKSLMEIKNVKTIEFVDWCPTGFKVGICNNMPNVNTNSHLARTDKNVTMLSNSSALGQAWQRICHKFFLLYSKRSFLHWFVGEGMDECEFTEALYNISTLVKDYEEIIVHNPEEKSPADLKPVDDDGVLPQTSPRASGAGTPHASGGGTPRGSADASRRVSADASQRGSADASRRGSADASQRGSVASPIRVGSRNSSLNQSKEGNGNNSQLAVLENKSLCNWRTCSSESE